MQKKTYRIVGLVYLLIIIVQDVARGTVRVYKSEPLTDNPNEYHLQVSFLCQELKT